jgi:WD40 repeat protein
LAADGKLLASCGIDKSIKLWDLNSNKIAMNISINDYAELNYLSMSEGTLNYSLKNIIK